MMRRLCVFGVVVVAAVTGGGAPHAQTPTTTQRVWTGTWEEHDAWEGSGQSRPQPGADHLRLRPRPGRVRGPTVGVTPADVERGVGREPLRLCRAVGDPPDQRGFTMRRYREDSVTILHGRRHAGAGTRRRGVGRRPHAGAEGATAGQLRDDVSAARERCAHATADHHGDARAVAGARHAERRRAHRLRLRKDMAKGGRPAGSFSVSVSGPVSAKVFPTASLEPTPGATLLHVEGRSAAPVRWKFVLVESSRLRGYATNADITPAFFEIYNLPSLRGRYGTMDPDLIFDPSKFEPPWDQSRQWKRPYPDSGPHKWSVLESNDEWRSVSVDVTAMDLGAHGELQVYVSSTCGDDWVQVEVDGATGAAGMRFRMTTPTATSFPIH